MNPEILTFIIKLIIGGIVSFLSILILSKTRELSWVMIVTGFLLNYVSLVFELMVTLAIFSHTNFCLFNIPLSKLICMILPNFFFILAFIFRLAKK